MGATTLSPAAQAALAACADLVGRTSASAFEIGYLHDDVPVEEAGWYAKAIYGPRKNRPKSARHLTGQRIIIEDMPGPAEAADTLARRLLDGGRCAHCRRKVQVSDGPGCRWTRPPLGDRWVRGCEDTS